MKPRNMTQRECQAEFRKMKAAARESLGGASASERAVKMEAIKAWYKKCGSKEEHPLQTDTGPLPPYHPSLRVTDEDGETDAT